MGWTEDAWNEYISNPIKRVGSAIGDSVGNIAENLGEQAEHYFGTIDPEKIKADPRAAANVYDQQMREALSGLRGRESPAEVLAKQNLGRVASAARRGMRRGGPLSVATGLGAMGPEQARIAAAGGRAVGAEQQRIDQLIGQGYAGMDRQALARAMSEQSRIEAIEAAERGMYDQARGDLGRKLSIAGVMGAQALSGLNKGNTWEAQEAARRKAANIRGASGSESVDPTSFGTGTGFA